MDLPSRLFMEHVPELLDARFMRWSPPLDSENCVLMRVILLTTRPDHLVYSCGGFFVKLFDVRGGVEETVVVRL